MLEPDPALKHNEVRAIPMKTAPDLGPFGRDDQFGARRSGCFRRGVAEFFNRPATESLSGPAGYFPDAGP
jgi:hypothetical protein